MLSSQARLPSASARLPWRIASDFYSNSFDEVLPILESMEKVSQHPPAPRSLRTFQRCARHLRFRKTDVSGTDRPARWKCGHTCAVFPGQTTPGIRTQRPRSLVAEVRITGKARPPNSARWLLEVRWPSRQWFRLTKGGGAACANFACACHASLVEEEGDRSMCQDIFIRCIGGVLVCVELRGATT